MLGVSAGPAEQLGAKNSISLKKDLRSFCTNVAMRKIWEFKITQKIEMIENRKCQHKKSHRKNLNNHYKNRIRSLSEVSHRIAVWQSLLQIFEPVRYRNAKQCICLEFVQRFQQNDVLTWSNDFFNFTHFWTCVKWYQQKSAQSHHVETFWNLISFMSHALKIVISKR